MGMRAAATRLPRLTKIRQKPTRTDKCANNVNIVYRKELYI